MIHFQMLDSLLKETSIKIEYVFYLLILFKNRHERIINNFQINYRKWNFKVKIYRLEFHESILEGFWVQGNRDEMGETLAIPMNKTFLF